ncbi:MAG: hypothetical protein Q7S21_07340 [archaeon]|nr:hypothetical protein [archaeon]
MELKDFIGQPCKSKSDYEFIPKKSHQLNLNQICAKLKNNGITIEIETPYLLMLRVDLKSVSFFKSGKIIVKTVSDSAKARKIAEKVISSLD